MAALFRLSPIKPVKDISALIWDMTGTSTSAFEGGPLENAVLMIQAWDINPRLVVVLPDSNSPLNAPQAMLLVNKQSDSCHGWEAKAIFVNNRVGFQQDAVVRFAMEGQKGILVLNADALLKFKRRSSRFDTARAPQAVGRIGCVTVTTDTTALGGARIRRQSSPCGDGGGEQQCVTMTDREFVQPHHYCSEWVRAASSGRRQ